MKQITGEELKQIQLNILKEIHSFCVEHQLTYYLAYGTLLGAVRHKGFIPWDDDIDICMPRRDYDIFCKTFKTVDAIYRVLDHHNTKGYYLPFAKVCDTRTETHETVALDIPGCGVYVDVFPLDGLSDDLSVAKKTHEKESVLMKLYAARAHRLPSLKELIHHWKWGLFYPIHWFVSPKWIANRIEKIAKQYAYEESKYVGVAYGFYGDRETMPREIFVKECLVTFEDGTYFAPANPDAYLTHMYGDYMQLPPEEKRVTHHSFKAYWKE